MSKCATKFQDDMDSTACSMAASVQGSSFEISSPTILHRFSNRRKNFSPSIHKQVRMSGCRIRPQNAPDLTRRAHDTINQSNVSKSNAPLDPQRSKIETNILHQSECRGVMLSLKIRNVLSHMHMALPGSRVYSSRTHLWIQTCQAGKFFPITTSSNVWVSHQASRYNTADIACTWHVQAIKVLQI